MEDLTIMVKRVDQERYILELLEHIKRGVTHPSQEAMMQDLLASPLPDYLPILAALQIKVAFATSIQERRDCLGFNMRKVLVEYTVANAIRNLS